MVRTWRTVRDGISLWAVMLAVGIAQAQAPSSISPTSTATPQSVEDVLHQMSDRADVIFVGQVTAIRPHDDGGMASGFVEVDFRVDQAIRGGVAGTYVLREWAGLWAGDARRYQVGQRLLMMLHAPGASGMSSPISGMDGAIPIRGAATVSQLAATADSVPLATADLRWLGARIGHPVSYPLQSALSPTPLTLSQQMAPAGTLKPVGEAITAPIATEDDTSSRTSIPVQQASVDTLIKLLSSWQKATDDVR